jgi:NhaA family Na+:H+ antiporter
VAWFILPVFAFAAAGFSFSALSLGDLAAPLPLGILLGLLIVKPIGVAGAAFLAIVLKLGERPTGASLTQILGVSMLCGVGFTISLFIGGLAFHDGAAATQVQLGVIGGSLLSILAGALVLRLAPNKAALLNAASE